MNKVLLVLLSFIGFSLFAQENSSYEKFIDPNDSILFVNLPRLSLPDSYKDGKAKELPDYHSNADNGYFRPIFNQYGWSCGQASSIGYGFTYELNRVRNTSALSVANQYPPIYTFNFFNNGEEGIGVNYLYSLDAIKHNGQPNVADYGGMGESLTYWSTGYDTYYNGMFNRVDEVYAIDVDDEEGLNTLKHYLYDHLDGSEVGGVVNFYTDLYSFTSLPPGTPEEGKAVITAFGDYTGHAMTFLGWNDSIRWDYNEDGQYTNDLDINEDGEITLKDWEIGGLILANTWGNDWADSGFCYVMYNVIAQEKQDGGIWNKQVNAIKVKEEYEPKITFKVEVTHNSRNKLRFIAGVASDTNRSFPQHTLEFPIFSYQGGDNYMQGDNSSNAFKTLEFGLDVTPLLSYIEPGEPAKFFFQVNENDPNHFYSGSINYFAVMDYTNGGLEVSSPMTDVPLNKNDKTNVSVVHSLSWDNINIDNEELPAYTPGVPYSHQMLASGGTEPYSWEVAPGYSYVEYADEYPDLQGEDITPADDHSGFAVAPLDFEFPFYDKLYDTVYMNVDGFLCFEPINYPYPYSVNDMILFKNEQMLSAFFNGELFIGNSNDNGMWYEGDESHASFRWVGTIVINNIWCIVDFTLSLFPDGNIDIYIDEFIFPESTGKITGLSYGDVNNFVLSSEPVGSYSGSAQKISFSPLSFTNESSIDQTGMLFFNPMDEDKIYNLSVRVTDDNNISDIKPFQISNGLIYEYLINSGDDDQIEYGEIPSIDFMLKNIGDTELTNVELTVETNDPFIGMLDDNEFAGSISPGNSVDLLDAISFELLQGIPNDYHFSLDLAFSSNEYSWDGRITLTAFAPIINMGTPIILDGNDNRLEPGETAQMIIPMTNLGFASAEGVEGSIFTADTMVVLDPPGGDLLFGQIAAGTTAYDTIFISADEDAPQGHELFFEANFQIEPDIELTDSFHLLIGRYPVLIADLDPEKLSGPSIKLALEDLNIKHSYEWYLPMLLEDYQNIFVVLGRQFGQHVLTDLEGSRLAQFLSEGGNIYMEGGITWYDDPLTEVHPMFQIDSEYVGWTEMDSVFGMEGTFLENMHYQYYGDAMYYNYELLPLSTSYVILNSPEEDHNYAIAYVGEGYKTIGSTLDFGAFVDGNFPNTKNYLMAKILDFLEVDVIITGVEDQPYGTSNKEVFSCLPNPVKGDLRVHFSLEKGQNISLDLYNIRGDHIFNIVDQQHYKPGIYDVSADVREIPSGVYICTLRSDAFVKSIKLIVTQ